jgi:RHS repeat-associated protein
VDSFTYNGDGLRVQKIDSTGTTNHVWDGQNILLETNASNIIQVVYTLGPAIYGNLISQSRSGVDSFYLFDALGSTRQLANSTGAVTDSYLYDSFGNILTVTGATVNCFRYVGGLGYYYDLDLSKYYLRARIYDPVAGHFLSRDRLGVLGQPFGLYEYVSNNPCNDQDPSGLQARWPRWPRAANCPPGTIFQGNDPAPNGCGDVQVQQLPILGRKLNLNCPNGGANFEGACNNHDDCYSTCGMAKNVCDQQFLTDLMLACTAANANPQRRCPNWTNLANCNNFANNYARAVRNGGQKPYNDAQNACAGKCVPICDPNLA